MDDVTRFTEQNRLAWNEVAERREVLRGFPSAQFFADGGVTLPDVVVASVGDVRGRRLLHLGCASGSDTLSWAVLGARATGVDISDVAIELASAKAAASGLTVKFVRADLFAMPDTVASGYDMVFASSGLLAWVPDIDAWARVCADALVPGGTLVLYELHPALLCLDVSDGRLVIEGDYFGRRAPTVDRGPLTGVSATESRYDFMWPLGDVVTALAKVGIATSALEEFPVEMTDWGCERFGDHLDRLTRFPGMFLLLAQK